MPEIRFDNGSLICADVLLGDPGAVRMGPGVAVRCEELTIDGPVKLGVLEEDGFREPSGSEIRAQRMFLGGDIAIGRGVLINCGNVWFGKGVRVGHRSTIRVKDWLVLGSGTVVQERCELAGRKIRIGRRGWVLPDAKIGGGSCFEPQSRFDAGPWLHLGVRSLVNTARPVSLGREVGIGTGTALYTHGAYPSALQGKPCSYGPVDVGDRAWIPGAVVNPGVRIGADAIVGVGSVVTRDIPAGALAGGVPARVLKEGCFPKPLSAEQRSAFFADFLGVLAQILAEAHLFTVETWRGGICLRGQGVQILYTEDDASIPPSSERSIVIRNAGGGNYDAAETTILLESGSVTGPVCPYSEKTLDQLRRYGVRFDVEPSDSGYRPWQVEGPAWPGSPADSRE